MPLMDAVYPRHGDGSMLAGDERRGPLIGLGVKSGGVVHLRRCHPGCFRGEAELEHEEEEEEDEEHSRDGADRLRRKVCCGDDGDDDGVPRRVDRGCGPWLPVRERAVRGGAGGRADGGDDLSGDLADTRTASLSLSEAEAWIDDVDEAAVKAMDDDLLSDDDAPDGRTREDSSSDAAQAPTSDRDGTDAPAPSYPVPSSATGTDPQQERSHGQGHVQTDEADDA